MDNIENYEKLEQIKKFHNNDIMKYLLLVIVLACSLSAFGQEVMYDGESNGALMLQVTEFQIKENQAISSAVTDALYAILFRGIPGSQSCNRPLAGTDETKIKDNQEYFSNMVDRSRINSFILYSAITYKKKNKIYVVKLTINLQALISDLENNNIIRRFGI